MTWLAYIYTRLPTITPVYKSHIKGDRCKMCKLGALSISSALTGREGSTGHRGVDEAVVSGQAYEAAVGLLVDEIVRRRGRVPGQGGQAGAVERLIRRQLDARPGRAGYVADLHQRPVGALVDEAGPVGRHARRGARVDLVRVEAAHLAAEVRVNKVPLDQVARVVLVEQLDLVIL